MLPLALPLVMVAAAIDVHPEFYRPDPFGGVVTVDRAETASTTIPSSLLAARGGYTSFHLSVRPGAAGPYQITVESPLTVDVFREWFHKMAGSGTYIPDALIPVRLPYRSSFPEPDNRIDGQAVQSFWIDVWVPRDTQPGRYPFTASVRSATGTASTKIDVEVTGARIPEDDVLTMDHNSYGTSFLTEQYPKLAARYGEDGFVTSDAFFRLIHAYHRIFYEHRGTLHQLGYGHGGKVAPEFAPALTGSGRQKKITSWDLFDRHYGPLLDGTAFAGTRRGAQPIPFVYLPINPEWPASFLWWGEPGYETEFVNVVGEMERHFREKGWTHTRSELFFNHKKRYKAFPWDGDEVRFLNDDAYFKDYARMMAKAVPKSTPVKFVFRTDSSWAMEQQFQDLAGVINFWVLGGGIANWNREGIRRAQERGDIVWYYGSPPEVTKPASDITGLALRGWLQGLNGFVHWLTVSPGVDPWFRFEGGGTALVYSGERFGLEEPIPSIRLKIQRNALQDLGLAGSTKAEVAKLFNGSELGDWWMARPALADQPPQEWSNNDIDEAMKIGDARLRKPDAASWQRVHDFVMKRSSAETSR